MNNLIAHRGLKKNAKENTLYAFKESIKNDNYLGFECDVRQTKDQVFIINHSPLINFKLIKNTPYYKLKKENITTLKEVLELKTSKIKLLELKDPMLNVNKLIKLLNKYQDNNIYLMSFHNNLIKKLATSSRFYKVGVLNYVLNSENDYQNYDFICLLESIYTPKIEQFFLKKNIAIFLYGIKKESTYQLSKNLYFITDKIVF